MTPLTPAELRAALEASPLSPALAAEVMATVDRQASQIKGLWEQLDIVRTQHDAEWDKAAKWRVELSAERAAHEATKKQLADVEAWQRAVASYLGFLNQPEGQDGYEVASADVVIAAVKTARADASAYVDVLSYLSEVGATGHDVDGDAQQGIGSLVERLESERAAHESTLEEARRISIALMRERDAERAKVARLREALIAVRDAMTATDQHPDATGPDWSDPRRPLASMVWRVLADTAPDSPNTPEVSR